MCRGVLDVALVYAYAEAKVCLKAWQAVAQFDVLDSHRLRPFHRRVALWSASGMFLDGYDLTVIAVVLPLLGFWNMSPTLVGALAAGTVFGTLLGALSFGYLADRFGRRTLYGAELLLLAGGALGSAVATGPVWFLIFRIAVGVGVGVDYLLAPTVVAEFVPASQRGRYVSLVSAANFFGSVGSYLIGYALVGLGADSWRLMLGIGALLAPVCILPRLWLPESPRWLAAQGRAQEAERILARLSGERSSVQADQSTPYGAMFGRPLLGALAFVSAFWFLYDVTAYGISTYTPTLFGLVNGQSVHAADLGAAAAGLIGACGGIFGLLLVDRWGRRPLLLTSFVATTLVLLVPVLFHHLGLVPLIAVFGGATLLANMGPGVLSTVYTTELFPAGLRASALGVATAVSRVGGILGILMFPGLLKTLGMDPSIWLFALSSLAGTLVVWAFAPETKGLPLERMAQVGLVPGRVHGMLRK